MRSLNIAAVNELANADVCYWKSSITGDIYGATNENIDWVQAFEFAQNRGLDLILDFTRFDRQLIMSKTEWRKRYEGNEISGRI